ncbi:MAG: hypothetical protein HQL51_04990 [Magnetococcales bacterium]|nr:hypothetical protein [Magnetococcales bacterium]
MSGPGGAAAQTRPAADNPAAVLGAGALPVKTVALFSSGVGYFQHAGEIPAGGTVQLQFSARQINDLLKSLVLEDLGGGQPGFVEYPSRDPIARILDEFQINLGGDPTLPDLIKQLRGARVLVERSGEKLEGAILGVEQRVTPGRQPNDPPIVEWMLNLSEKGKMRALPLSEARQIELLNPALKEELDKALLTLDQHRGKDKRPVLLRFPGPNARKARIGYVVETPVWKTSYRLLLPEQAEAPAIVQGWAIVENQTDHDWERIRLQLISGRPISFIQDLDQPLYATRPTVKARLEPGVLPRLHEEGIDLSRAREEAAREAMEKSARRMMAKSAPPPPMASAPAAMAAPSPMREMADASANGFGGGGSAPWTEQPVDPSGLQAAAEASASGSLFRFSVEGVTLPRHRSAMIPIVADPVKLSRVSLYNPRSLANHPLHGVLLDNTTGKHLPPGPVALFENGGYAGDGQLDHLPPGQQRFITYAVDLEVKALPPASQEESRLAAAKIVQGVLTVQGIKRENWTYALENTGSAGKTVILEHPVRPGWKLIEPDAPLETTSVWRRFRLELAPGQTLTFRVGEERIEEETQALVETTASALQVVLEGEGLSAVLREALLRVAALHQEVESTRERAQRAEQAVQALQNEQGRIRENLRALDKGTPPHDQMIRKLMEKESALEKQQAELEAARQLEVKQQQALEAQLNALTVE